MKVPYIGITGFMTSFEVKLVLNSFPSDVKRKVMIGVLAGLKSLRGETNKWPGRYPKVEEIKNIFIDDPVALNLIHYNSKEPDSLLDQLLKMTEFGGPYLNGFQLNMAWPPKKTIERYKKMNPGKQIILQVGGMAFEFIMNSPTVLANHIERYSETIDYVLLDPSGGLGKEFDPEKIRPYLEAIFKEKIDIGVGVAGGLSPSSLGILEPLVKDFPNLCIDAEGKLRNKEDDSLNIAASTNYLLKSLELFESSKQ